MSNEPRGRVAPSPPPPFLKGTSDSFVGAYPWNNVAKEAIGRDRPLTRAELRQVQGVLNRIDRLPFFLQTLFTSRYNFIRRKKSPLGGLYFLKNTFERKLLPRLERVNELCGMNESASIGFLSERDQYARLPDMNDKELRKFAARIASQLWSKYEELSDAWAEAHGGKETLFTDEAQSHLYGQVAGIARTFNINPMYWKKHPVELLIDIGLKQMKHRAGGELVRVGKARHVPVNTILNATAGVFGRGGFQFKELAGHTHALFKVAVGKHQIIEHKAAKVLT